MPFSKSLCLLLSVFIAPAPLFAQSDPTIAQMTQRAMEASLAARQALQVAVPRGAIMAFNLSNCPDGWSDFTALDGRMILGAGPGENGEIRATGIDGGAEAHTLTAEEMPSHNHNNEKFDRLLQMSGRTVGAGSDRTGAGEPDIYVAGEIVAAGGDQPHNNMPPFHTLKFCERK